MPSSAGRISRRVEAPSFLDPLLGRDCTRVTIDRFAPPLVLWFLSEGPVARVEIAGPFTIRSETSAVRLDPADDDERSRLGRVLRLVGQSVTSVSASDDATLRLGFSGGDWIEVDDQSDLEAWWFEIDPDDDTTAS